MSRATRNLVYQAIALCLSLGVLALVAATTIANLESRGITLGLYLPTGPEPVSTRLETLAALQPGRQQHYALVVGVGNTLVVSLMVAVLSTVLGGGTRHSQDQRQSLVGRFCTQLGRILAEFRPQSCCCCSYTVCLESSSGR